MLCICEHHSFLGWSKGWQLQPNSEYPKDDFPRFSCKTARTISSSLCHKWSSFCVGHQPTIWGMFNLILAHLCSIPLYRNNNYVSWCFQVYPPRLQSLDWLQAWPTTSRNTEGLECFVFFLLLSLPFFKIFLWATDFMWNAKLLKPCKTLNKLWAPFT